MARRNVLKGLLGGGASAPATPADTPPDISADTRPAPQPPRPARGAIGAVSRSIADLKSRSVIEIDPALIETVLIETGGVQDRLDTDEASETTLRRSIAEYGQQVPVLVRPHPEAEGRFQIVYGRRRLLALRDLGQPVKALVRDLDDRELILAQGQENTARRDLSFIEKVNFARQLDEGGYDRKVICDALSVDKTLASRMLAIAARISPAVIAAIGAAPAIGRDRWSALAERIEETETDEETLISMINLGAGSDGSDERFRAAWDYLSRPARAARATSTQTATLRSSEGLPFGQVRTDTNFCTLRLRLAQTEGFESWLVDHLPGLFTDWQRRHGDVDVDVDVDMNGDVNGNVADDPEP